VLEQPHQLFVFLKHGAYSRVVTSGNVRSLTPIGEDGVRE
jgi:hypothetical protein